jgi:Glycosyl transferases group 1
MNGVRSPAGADRRHVLIATHYAGSVDNIGEGQLSLFERYRGVIRSELGVTTERMNSTDLDGLARACDAAADRVGAFLIRHEWRTDPVVVERFFADLRLRHPDKWIVAIDPWDQCTGRFLGALKHVDRLVKYQGLRNRNDYYRPMVGGTVLTDHMARLQVYDPTTDAHLGSEVPAGGAERITVGWYYWQPRALRLKLAVQRLRSFFPARRPIDVVCHVSIGKRGEGSYYAHHRLQALAAIKQLAPQYAIRVSAEHDDEPRTVTREQYREDARNAKIMVSPFGWGDVSSRDYEAVLYGNLLVRPRVDHVEVHPDIFVPDETYVPVAWDCSDLAEKCRHYLQHPDEAQRIIANARQACANYFSQRGYLDAVREILDLPKTA